MKDTLEMGYWAVSCLILIVTAYYVYHAPIKAVQIGRQLNDEQNKDTAKRNLFLSLFAHRGSPVHPNFVNGLNTIDVVFHDTPKVLTAWHKYYESLNQKDHVDPERTWMLLRVELLSEMATSLGYGELKQVDITKHYYPEGHQNQQVSEIELRNAAVDYFKTGTNLYVRLIDTANNPPTPPKPAKTPTGKV